MAKVNFVKRARNDIPEIDVKKGESYYWWKTRRGSPKQMSKTPPRRSATTSSWFYARLWDIEGDIAQFPADDSLPNFVADVVQELRDLAEECQDNLDNMPEGLQQGDTGMMLQERIEACNNAADELEGIVSDYDAETEEEEDYWTEKLEEVQAVSIDAP
jgi:hypothetical protein